MSSEDKIPGIDEVETLLVLHQHRAKPLGSQVAKQFLPGEKYQQTGLDKLQVLGTGYCTRNLNAVVPANTKRVAPEKGKEKFNDPNMILAQKIDALVDVVNKLIAKK